MNTTASPGAAPVVITASGFSFIIIRIAWNNAVIILKQSLLLKSEMVWKASPVTDDAISGRVQA